MAGKDALEEPVIAEVERRQDDRAAADGSASYTPVRVVMRGRVQREGFFLVAEVEPVRRSAGGGDPLPAIGVAVK